MTLKLEDVGHHFYGEGTSVRAMMEDALARFLLLPNSAESIEYLAINGLANGLPVADGLGNGLATGLPLLDGGTQCRLEDWDVFEEITPVKWEYIRWEEMKTLKEAELQSGDVLVFQPKFVCKDFKVRASRSSVDVFNVALLEGRLVKDTGTDAAGAGMYPPPHAHMTCMYPPPHTYKYRCCQCWHVSSSSFSSACILLLIHTGIDNETAARIASSRAVLVQGALAEREAAAKQKEADAVMAKLLEEEAAKLRALDEKKKRDEVYMYTHTHTHIHTHTHTHTHTHIYIHIYI